jgi:hypothetical protein
LAGCARGGIPKNISGAQLRKVSVSWQGIQVQVQRSPAKVSGAGQLVKKQPQDVVELILIPALVLIRGQR